MKRLLREAFEDVRGELSGELDVVIVVRPQAWEFVEREGLAGVSASLQELVSRCRAASA